ncbi:hypothetical protein B0T17DRAFT_618057 [Bombardia bombarda]|uniref:Uncharacterized protein n=1 Tax=Bombardia bombarda TaxID=252184 RepID=A0AA39WU72_9PEZI|nr:hypothetical protein B0T17DRAFT_618057 [Bombardia bombarda]
MHLRNTSLLLLLAGSASTAHTLTRQCLRTRSRELASKASCGDEGSINYCFSQAISLDSSADTPAAEEIERCFSNAGCTSEEAHIEAFWTLQRCSPPPSADNTNGGSDLRRHRRAEQHLRNEDMLGAAKAAAAMLLEVREAAPAPMPLNPRQDGTTTTTTGVNTAVSPFPCTTTTEVSISSCPIQSTGPSSGKALSCFPTTSPSAVCRDGLICSQGNQSCMYNHNQLDLAGIIIAIVFAVAVVVSVFSICFLCCREKRSQKRLERAEEAAKIVHDAKNAAVVAAKRPVAGARAAADADAMDGQPLMRDADAGARGGGHDLPPLPPMPQLYGGGGGGGGGGYQQMGQGHSDAGGHNPFQDEPDSHPLR